MKYTFLTKRICMAIAAGVLCAVLSSCASFYVPQYTAGDPSDGYSDPICTTEQGGYPTEEVTSEAVTECVHAYTLNHLAPTCVTEGFNSYTCPACGDSYLEILPVLAHTPGAEPTFDEPQTCTFCHTVLRDKLIYTPYAGEELAINYYFRYSEQFTPTVIDSRYHGTYTQGPIRYLDRNGAPLPLTVNIPIQEFYSHKVLSVSPLSTDDGKNYETSSGFKVSFDFQSSPKRVQDLYAWDKGDKCLRDEFSHLDESEINDVVRVVASYPVLDHSSYYNTVYEVVDFSSSYIEIAKKTADGYITLKKIESVDDWKLALALGELEICNDNSTLFFDEGLYRVLFKYDMIWVTDPAAPVYDEEQDLLYPFARINAQYESFYVTVTNEKGNVLIPSNLTDVQNEFFCQLRAMTTDTSKAFVPEYSGLLFGDQVVFRLAAKVGKAETGCFYERRHLSDFRMVVSVYNERTDTYDEYQSIDLLSMLSDDTLNGGEITVNIGKNEQMRGKKHKISLLYTINGVSEQLNYYDTLYW